MHIKQQWVVSFEKIGYAYRWLLWKIKTYLLFESINFVGIFFFLQHSMEYEFFTAMFLLLNESISLINFFSLPKNNVAIHTCWRGTLKEWTFKMEKWITHSPFSYIWQYKLVYLCLVASYIQWLCWKLKEEPFLTLFKRQMKKEKQRNNRNDGMEYINSSTEYSKIKKFTQKLRRTCFACNLHVFCIAPNLPPIRGAIQFWMLYCILWNCWNLVRNCRFAKSFYKEEEKTHKANEWAGSYSQQPSAIHT